MWGLEMGLNAVVNLPSFVILVIVLIIVLVIILIIVLLLILVVILVRQVWARSLRERISTKTDGTWLVVS